MRAFRFSRNSVKKIVFVVFAAIFLFGLYHLPLVYLGVRFQQQFEDILRSQELSSSMVEKLLSGPELMPSLDLVIQTLDWYPWIQFGMPKEWKEILKLYQANRELAQVGVEVLTTLNSTASKDTFLLRVLLQNDHELRPTGGFIGSYVDIELDGLTIKTISAQDIYEPDGQLKGYVKPPEVIEKYLYQTGGWKLRDANWDPQFPESVEAIDWFFSQAEYPLPDVYLAVNAHSIVKLLQGVGPIYVSDYQIEISAENILRFLQNEAEQNFFPGSTSKRDAISAVSRSVLRTVFDLSRTKQTLLLLHSLELFKSQDFQVWFRDPVLQEKASSVQVTGEFLFGTGVDEYLYPVEANVGINKANCCVNRAVELEYVFSSDNTLRRVLRVEYQNENPLTPNPPLWYGGGYLVYLRLFSLPEWECKDIQVEDQYEDIEFERTISCNEQALPGSVMTSTELVSHIRGNSRGSVLIESSSSHDLLQTGSYTVQVQKQPGMNPTKFSLKVTVEGHDSIYVNGVQLESGEVLEFENFESRLFKFELR